MKCGSLCQILVLIHLCCLQMLLSCGPWFMWTGVTESRLEGQQHLKKKRKKTNSIDAKILLTFTDKAITAFNMSYSRRECESMQKFQPYHRPPVMGRHYSASLHFSVVYTQSGPLIKCCLISTGWWRTLVSDWNTSRASEVRKFIKNQKGVRGGGGECWRKKMCCGIVKCDVKKYAFGYYVQFCVIYA